jgi:DNA adenine methylase
MEDKLREANRLLQGVELKDQPFAHVLNDAKEGDFVYFDPPYYPLSKTSSFTCYSGSFLEKEQEQLADVFKELDEMGCKIMLSNSDTQFIRGLYDPKRFNVQTVEARRAINSKAEKRGAVTELLVMNYETPKMDLRTYIHSTKPKV